MPNPAVKPKDEILCKPFGVPERYFFMPILNGGIIIEWFNVYGLFFIIVIMVPNIIYAIKCKDGFENKWKNKVVEIFEQIGRYGCFGFMIFNIPNTGLWFFFK